MTRILMTSLLASFVACASAGSAFAQDRGACTARCGGTPGGEAANPPKVVACFRKCMSTTGNSDSTNTRRK